MCTVVISEISENDNTAGKSSVCISNPGNMRPTKNLREQKRDFLGCVFPGFEAHTELSPAVSSFSLIRLITTV